MTTTSTPPQDRQPEIRPSQAESTNPALAGQSNDPSFPNIWQELTWRGLVHVSTDEAALEDVLSGDPIAYYCGVDPTAPALRLGHLVQILVRRRLQLARYIGERLAAT